MASVSVSHLIIFIASLVVAASVAGTLVTGVDQLSDSMSDRSWDLSDRISTDVTIISDPGSDAIYDENAEEIVVLVKNTGSVTLDAHPSQVDVLVNGLYVTNVTVEALDDDTWTRGTVAAVTIDHSLEPGDHRLRIHVNGNDAVLVFRV